MIVTAKTMATGVKHSKKTGNVQGTAGEIDIEIGTEIETARRAAICAFRSRFRFR